MLAEQVKVLHVEDDDVDVEGVQRAFKKLKIPNEILLAKDGVEALEILRREDDEKLRPFLILLDLNMPRMGGIEFLGQIRRDEKLKDSIVFVLTTSSAEEDRASAYDFNVAGYIVKSHLETGLTSAAKLLNNYCHVVEFP